MELPKIGAPATRALASAGIHKLEDCTAWSAADLVALHGFGQKGLEILREALKINTLTLKAE